MIAKNIIYILQIILLFSCKYTKSNNADMEDIKKQSIGTSLYLQNQYINLYEEKNSACFTLFVDNSKLPLKSITSGFFISKDGYGVVNSKNLIEKQNYKLRYNGNGDFHPVDIIEINPDIDVALIKVKEFNETPFITVNNKYLPKTGTLYLAIGSTEDSTFGYMISGTISKNLKAEIDRRNLSNSFILIDKEVPNGMEGGPVFSIDGRLIGVMQRSDNLLKNSWGYVLPVTTLNLFIESNPIFIEKKFTRQRGIHEIPILTPYLIQKLNLQRDTGILISFLDKDSPGEKSGLQRYDLIIKINNIEIKNKFDLEDAFSIFSQEKDIIIEIERNNKILNFSISE
jgi:serine protease DegQ